MVKTVIEPVFRPLVLSLLTIFGILLSRAWQGIAQDGAGWQEFFHERLEALEGELNIPGIQLFSEVSPTVERYREKGQINIVDTVQSVARVFEIGWWILLVVAGVWTVVAAMTSRWFMSLFIF